MNDCQKGRSMIEMLGVLAVVGVLSIGGISGYGKAIEKYRINKFMDQMSELTMNIRALFLQSNSFHNISTEVLIKAGAVPFDMVYPKDSASYRDIVHILGGTISVFASNDGQGREKAFELYAEGITTRSCVILATMDWGQDVASGFQAFYIGHATISEPLMLNSFSTSVSDPNTGIYTPKPSELAIPLPVVRAQTACNCDLDPCTLGWKYQ